MTSFHGFQLRHVCSVTVPDIPISWTAPRRTAWGGMMSTTRYSAYKEKVRAYAQFAHIQAGHNYPICGQFVLEFEFRFLDKSGKKGIIHDQKPDLSNLIKAAEDGIKGVIINDDCEVGGYLQPIKRWVNSANDVGFTVVIYEVVK